MLATEKTLILVKPDAFARGLSGEIIARFERKGLKIVAVKHMSSTEDRPRSTTPSTTAPVLRRARDFITSGPIVAIVFEGDNAIKAARQVIGATNPLEATTGSIRGDFAIAVGTNMVHGSDSPESGIREAGLFFPELEEQKIFSRSSTAGLSASPQRRAILEQLGLAFAVRASGVEEETQGDPLEVALENARRKARVARPSADMLGRRHAGRGRRHIRQAAPTPRRRRVPCGPSPAARTRWWGIALVLTASWPRTGRTTEVTSARPHPLRSPGTSRRGNGKAAPAGTPSRAAGPRSWRHPGRLPQRRRPPAAGLLDLRPPPTDSGARPHPHPPQPPPTPPPPRADAAPIMR